jgi:hypothetical protein
MLTVLLAACAGPVPKIDSSPATLSAIKSIVVVRSPEPKTYTVLNFGHPGMYFGAIGGVIAAVDQNGKQDRLSVALKANGLSVTAALAERVAAQLSQAGYQVKVEDGPWEEADGKAKLVLAKVHSDADGLLLISPTIVGFVATGAAGDYLPTITAVVTLLGKDRKVQIYRGYHASGWQPKAEGWKTSSAKTTFTNFDALMADPARTGASLTEAAAAIATTVASDLKR